MAELHTPAEITKALRDARTIAVLGVNDKPDRPAHYVPEYLHQQGYRIVPVNPALAGQTLFGEIVRASLAEIDEPIDIVDVFRRPEMLPGHLDDIRAMKHRPKIVWLQLGIRNDDFARDVEAAGIDVVQSKCTLAEHRSLGVGPVPR